MKIDVWYKSVIWEKFWSNLSKSLSLEGFDFDNRANQDALPYMSNITIQDVTGEMKIYSRIEGHFEVEISSSSNREIFLPALFRLFERLINESQNLPNECILQDSLDETYPFFTLSSLRSMEPISVYNMDSSNKKGISCKDKNYWSEVGNRLHFISKHLFDRLNIESDLQWSERIGASLYKARYGSIFDCGWSLRWPFKIPKGKQLSK